MIHPRLHAWLRRNWFLALPVAFLLVAYWKIFLVWFRSDDFAWLGLKLSIDGPRKLWESIFYPQAQGTIRILSERLPYLTFSTLFGYDPVPFRLLSLATQAANGILLGRIVLRITGSRVAAALAPMLWLLNAGMAVVMCWFAAYNQLLAAFFLLLAFWAFLAGRRRLTWIAFLAGFAALETNVVFPVLLVWYCLLLDRRRLRECWPFFLPAALFAGLHLFVIPKAPDPNYKLYFDLEIPVTLWRYFTWSLGPRRWTLLQEIPPYWDAYGTPLLVTACAAFVGFSLWRRDGRGIFFLGCFVITLGPLLPLKNHVSEYYLALASFGLVAFLAYAAVTVWQTNRWLGLVAVACLALHVWSGYKLRWLTMAWYLSQTRASESLVHHVREARRLHPSQTILLTDIGRLLFYQAIADDAFRLYGVKDVWLAPGGSHELTSDAEAPRFTYPAANVLWSADRGLARVYRWESNALRDVTKPYLEKLIQQPAPPLPQWLDLGKARFAEVLGPGWTPINAANDTRTMQAHAQLQMGGLGRQLHLLAFAPAALFAGGPVTLQATFNGHAAPPVNLAVAGAPFDLDIPIPEAARGAEVLNVELTCNRTVKDAQGRDVAIVFGWISVRD